MIKTPLVFAAISDFSGKLRGKSFPLADLEKRSDKGVGWTPTNVQITCFDKIAETPFGSLGDLLLVPDPETLVDIDYGDHDPSDRFVMGDIRELDGTPWSCCTRSLLKHALARLENLGGVKLVAAFEHEFQLDAPTPTFGEAYTHAGFQSQRRLGETLMGALDVAGMSTDTFMNEYGPDQFEVTVNPTDGLRAADNAAALREITRSVAKRLGERASFTPIRDPDNVGNGVHIHISFKDAQGSPTTYDRNGLAGMSQVTGSFVAGILKYLDSIIALTAPSDVSYLRLTPHRWSAAYNNLGLRDREASLRICPTSAQDEAGIARQYNFEFRAADAAASPYLALAAIVHAGAQGLEEGLAPPPVTQEDLSLLSSEDLNAKGYVRLPETLPEALARFEKNQVVRGWFPKEFSDVYLAHKRGELAYLGTMTVEERCDVYAKTY
ncbi:glutamine synthetase family protein [Sulfitobacter geojensis]|uniref:glutamine synthetase family protein n=1 Tax=Sulfitobacter geojensis TaxID=1342299 RepID=UPI0007DA0930|nr:glutamine synthetase family protein [Sulfitobacter geojensis]MDG1868219.1 glutamine synthetase family protein [Yoonia sp.]OAN92985.1 glutamine synthetase [Sulfitobacter geojensis]